MRIVISSGHGKYIRGASGSPVPPQLDEVDEARRVVERVADLWRQVGIDVDVFHDNTSHDQSTNLSTIVAHHNNAGPHDLDVSVHFNAYDGSAHGVECLYVTQAALAERVADAIAEVGFTNRGPKYRSDLYFLNNTREPAILIETCFCDNSADSGTYTAKFDDVCQAIAESISGQQVPDEPDEPDRPPIEWRPPERPDDEVNKLALTVQCYGDLIVTINGQEFRAGDEPNTPNRATMVIAAEGDLIVSINGQDFHGPFEPPAEGAIPENQRSIEATVFGGSSDPNYSAYPPYDGNGNGKPLDDTSLYVALPWKFPEPRPRVRVMNTATKASAIGEIWDVGPWCTTNNYWAIPGEPRPLAETCHDDDRPLPSGSGPNAGQVPSNAAGIDLSPALAKAIGINGKGLVDWELVT